ncbi:MAG: SUMF1/EgtB/PvdO family nonheme iron enzyme, partial [Armatimonadetes bacterium]|nr:SUMF1/EgtB/PvdO family nonheme iron enzyme [Armatimonadota bacterium]
KVFTSDQKDRFLLPTAANIVTALQAVRERATGDDALVFMFSGHGLQDGDEPYLLTVESNRALLDRTALPMGLVNEALKGFDGRSILMLIDACRNDPLAARGTADAHMDEGFAKGVRPRMEVIVGRKLPAVVVLMACDVGQRAFDWQEEGHGAFTSYLLRALAGEARAENGDILMSRLGDYVVREVTAWAQRARRQQTPRLDNPAGADFVLLHPTPKPSPPPPAAPPPVTPQPAQPQPAASDQVLELLLPAPLQHWRDQMPKQLQYRLAIKDGMLQVQIPAGEFMMGDPAGKGGKDEQPQKRVYVGAFWMDVHEVTIDKYRRFCRETRYRMPQQRDGNGELCPVGNVTWVEAAAYAEYVGRKLPTEAQWERAARGGLVDMPFAWGDKWERDKANCDSRGAVPVGSYPPNGYGLFDMIGNVFEWCRDAYDAGWYAKMPDREPVNDRASGNRVIRGGSASSSAGGARVTTRLNGSPTYHAVNGGFRCVSER